MSHKEWSIKNEFNPFNTMKILKHVDYWRKINIEDPEDIFVPPPIAVTIDPANVCNYRCVGCNARKIITESDSFMSQKWMEELPEFLKDWKVRAVTLAGGGEPLLSPFIGKFLEDSVDIGSYELALITNGYMIDRYLPQIMFSTKWVGVSVDASNAETYAKIKNVKQDAFVRVIDNIKRLTKSHRKVTYKFLINKENIDDIFEAAKLARDCGCCAIHLRPIGATWYDDDRRPIFSGTDVAKAIDAIGEAREVFEDDTFRVFGVTHKFDNNWKLSNCFAKCWACFMYLVIEPNGVISTCCDNRGNPAMQLATGRHPGLKSPWDITKHWGKKEHVLMFDAIDVKKCPRCTFTLHNQLYEHCILNDTMDMDFI